MLRFAGDAAALQVARRDCLLGLGRMQAYATMKQGFSLQVQYLRDMHCLVTALR